MRRFLILTVLVLCFSTTTWPLPASAQSGIERHLFQPTYIVSPNVIKNQGVVYHLWGTSIPESIDPLTLERGRAFLSHLIGDNTISCFIYGDNLVQCTSASGQDLSKAVIENGYAYVDRKIIAGTNQQDEYLKAEKMHKRVSLEFGMLIPT